MNGESRGGGADEQPRRLVEEQGGQEAWALDLLRAAEPYQARAGRKQRIRLSLGHAPRRAPLLLRPLVAGSVLMLGGAIAAASLGPALPRWMSRAVERVADVVRPGGSGHASSEARRAARPARLASVAEPVAAPALEAP
ncbi:MAG TPA: hypothetical protein VHM31_14760, partial [Polyangia bacterium]|nr:hypothetical protein [Polyangia bacterium]